MYYLEVEDSFDSAHFLKGYCGKCKNIHGHRWSVLITIKSELLKVDEKYKGMICDFKEVKADLKKLIEKFDHKLIIEKNSISKEDLNILEKEFEIEIMEFRPTAENFAKFFFENMKYKYSNIESCKVYETPNNAVMYKDKNTN